MRRLIQLTWVGSIALIASAAASANEPGVQYQYAPVVDVEPIVRLVRVERPRRECWNEEVYEEVPGPGHSYGRPGRGSAGATIAGGVVGGVIGRQFGGGKGRDAMTLFGTLVGAAIANDRSSRRAAGYQSATHYDYERRPVTVERCRVDTESFEEERVEGYRVTYLYDGDTYTMRTREHPGEQVKLRVAVRPVAY